MPIFLVIVIVIVNYPTLGRSDVTYLWSQCDHHFVGQHVALCVVKWWRFVTLFESNWISWFKKMSVPSLSYWESDVYWRQNNKHFAELAPQNGGKQLIWINYFTVTLCIAPSQAPDSHGYIRTFQMTSSSIPTSTAHLVDHLTTPGGDHPVRHIRSDNDVPPADLWRQHVIRRGRLGAMRCGPRMDALTTTTTTTTEGSATDNYRRTNEK